MIRFFNRATSMALFIMSKETESATSLEIKLIDRISFALLSFELPTNMACRTDSRDN